MRSKALIDQLKLRYERGPFGREWQGRHVLDNPPATRAEAERLLAEIDGLLAVWRDFSPASRQEIITIMAALAEQFPVQQRTEAQWRRVFDDFAVDLAGHAAGVIDEAAARWRRQPKPFFPHPGAVLQIIREIDAERCLEVHRLEMLRAVLTAHIDARPPPGVTGGV